MSATLVATRAASPPGLTTTTTTTAATGPNSTTGTPLRSSQKTPSKPPSSGRRTSLSAFPFLGRRASSASTADSGGSPPAETPPSRSGGQPLAGKDERRRSFVNLARFAGSTPSSTSQTNHPSSIHSTTATLAFANPAPDDDGVGGGRARSRSSSSSKPPKARLNQALKGVSANLRNRAGSEASQPPQSPPPFLTPMSSARQEPAGRGQDGGALGRLARRTSRTSLRDRSVDSNTDSTTRPTEAQDRPRRMSGWAGELAPSPSAEEPSLDALHISLPPGAAPSIQPMANNSRHLSPRLGVAQNRTSPSLEVPPTDPAAAAAARGRRGSHDQPTRPGIAARLRTLPRLASYTVTPTPGTAGASESGRMERRPSGSSDGSSASAGGGSGSASGSGTRGSDDDLTTETVPEPSAETDDGGNVGESDDNSDSDEEATQENVERSDADRDRDRGRQDAAEEEYASAEEGPRHVSVTHTPLGLGLHVRESGLAGSFPTSPTLARAAQQPRLQRDAAPTSLPPLTSSPPTINSSAWTTFAPHTPTTATPMWTARIRPESSGRTSAAASPSRPSGTAQGLRPSGEASYFDLSPTQPRGSGKNLPPQTPGDRARAILMSPTIGMAALSPSGEAALAGRMRNVSPARPKADTAAGLGVPTETRPAMSARRSRSVLELSPSPRRRSEERARPGIEEEMSPATPGGQSPAPERRPPGSSGVVRRQSMYEMRSGAPPPYLLTFRGATGATQVIHPREEEGREGLPPYFCAVHLEGWMPRKMEFKSPGVQAKDRAWKRQYFILHGTMIRIYRTDPHVYPVAGEEELLDPDTNQMLGGGGGGFGSFAHWDPTSEATTRERSGSRPLHFHGGPYGEIPSTGATKLRQTALAKAANQLPTHHNAAVRVYSLQNAESGLAADYLKRKHVVRVRAEGEQFLLAAKDDRGVIDLIEALQAATNVALDLDQRPLPKFITLPRRRRRRRRPDTDLQAAIDASNAAAGAGGQAGAAATVASPSAIHRDRLGDMLAEEQDESQRAGAMAV